MTRFHAELSVQGIKMSPETFDEAFDAIADALYDCQGIENADLAGDSSTQIATFSMDVEHDDEIEAFRIAIGAVRTALHASGGATPNWEQNFSMLRHMIETRAGSDAFDSVDA